MEEYLIAAELLDRANEEGFLFVFNEVGRGIKLNLPMSKELWDTDISALLISATSFHGLSDAKLRTIGRVMEKIKNGELDSVATLEKQNIIEIKTAILDLAYSKLTEKEKAAFWLQIVKKRGLCDGK